MRGPADAGFSHSPQGAFHFLCSPVFLCSVLTHPACFGIMNEHRPDGEIGRRSRLKICRQQCRTGSSPVLGTIAWGVSSAGRALASHVRGHGFESRTLHHCPQSSCLWGFSLIVQHFAYKRLKWALFLYANAGWQGCRSTSPQIHHEKTAENRKQVIAPAVAQKQPQTSLSSAGDGPLLFQMFHNCQPNDAKSWGVVYPASQFLYN